MGEITLTEKQQHLLNIITKFHARELDIHEAAATLGMSERQVRRLRNAFLENGAAGLIHGNSGRTPTNAVSRETVNRVVELITTRYVGLQGSPFSRHLRVHGAFLGLSIASACGCIQQWGESAPSGRCFHPFLCVWRHAEERAHL